MFHGAVLVCLLFVSSPARGGPFGGRTPVETIEDELLEKKSEKELAAQARQDEIDERNAEKEARVIILTEPAWDITHRDMALQRNIHTRIARPNARFYPEIDLYQAGRKQPDRSLRHSDQLAVVPDDAIPRIMTAWEEVSTIRWDSLNDQEWGLKASALRKLADEIWFLDREELREPVFLLFSEIGRAAENSNNSAPPFYEFVGDQSVNYYWYLAGAMAHEEPTLLGALQNPEVAASITLYKSLLDRGSFTPLTLSFEMTGEFDPKAYAAEYQTFINGREVVIADDKGLWGIPPGRADIYLSRDDGHSLSDRVQLDKLQDKFYFVRDVARKSMGIDFIDQLMENPYECKPEVDGHILDYLAIYSKLHPLSQVYIAIPDGGSTAPNKIFMWRWDRTDSELVKVLDDTGGFPVRFAVLLGSGLTFNTATYSRPDPAEVAQATADNTGPGGKELDGLQAALDDTKKPPKLDPSSLPLLYHLRAHYGWLMMTTGIELAVNLVPNTRWSELYYTNGNKVTADGNSHALTETVDREVQVLSNPDDPLSDKVTELRQVEIDILRERSWQRLVFFGVGGVLGKNRAAGFGPRGYVRTGWYNLPHAVDISAHLGMAMKAPWKKDTTGRVRPLLDTDFWGGVMVPFRDSVHIDGDNSLGSPLPNFGATLTAGTTF